MNAFHCKLINVGQPALMPPVCVLLAWHSPVVRGKLFASKMFDKVLQNEGRCFHLLCAGKKEDRGGWLSKSCLSMMCEEWRGDTKCSPDHCLRVWLASHSYKASLARHPAPHIVLLFFLYLKPHTNTYNACTLVCTRTQTHMHTHRQMQV